jgi:hypothetical protein
VGIWTFQGGSQVAATCASPGALPLSQALSGTRISIYPGATTDLIFDLGCRCAVGVQVAADGTRATLAGDQSCLVIGRGVQMSGQITALALDLTADGSLAFSFSGTGDGLGTGNGSCASTVLSGSGTLTRTSSGKISCGDPATAVGVLPFSPRDTTDCPLGAGGEDLRITMHDEDDLPCSDATGSRGEGSWVLPDDPPRPPPVCGLLRSTTLTFCRVDGASFKSLTTELAPEQEYAVLKLGSRCPNGSIEVTKTIDNEDQPVGDGSSHIGDPGPNQLLSGPLGTITQLTFCYFRGAAAPDAVMQSFPDLGFPYAVFHDFDGPQPPWVILKRWLYSDDEDAQIDVDRYDSTDQSALTDFPRLVGNPKMDTVFNLARVR